MSLILIFFIIKQFSLLFHFVIFLIFIRLGFPHLFLNPPAFIIGVIISLRNIYLIVVLIFTSTIIILIIIYHIIIIIYNNISLEIIINHIPLCLLLRLLILILVTPIRRVKILLILNLKFLKLSHLILISIINFTIHIIKNQ